MQLNGSIVKCECGSELFRFVRKLDGLYVEQRTICAGCDAVVDETTMDADIVESGHPFY